LMEPTHGEDMDPGASDADRGRIKGDNAGA